MGGAAGGDCSDRICPYELAWVDKPDSAGTTHKYAECAAKGICDRETGQCECLAGYNGKACARQTCPDDCSGHGSCVYMEDLTFGAVYNDYYDGSSSALLGMGVGAVRPASIDSHWDFNRARACVCDGGWSGINCASRMCPYGNDAMDSRSNGDVAQKYQIQDIKLMLGGANRKADHNLEATNINVDVTEIATYMEGKTFALTFTSKMNEAFTTKPIKIESGWDTANALGLKVTSALKELPNHIITGVSTTAAVTASQKGVGIQLLVTFTGDSTHGTQNLLEVSVNPCADGCIPLITGLPHLVSSTNTTSSVSESQAADFNSYECGRRGKCDYDVGVCSCFEGFTGEACTTITALV
jgi:hypothetical protein